MSKCLRVGVKMNKEFLNHKKTTFANFYLNFHWVMVLREKLFLDYQLDMLKNNFANSALISLGAVKWHKFMVD